MTTSAPHSWSSEQLAIFEWFRSGTVAGSTFANLVVEAFAGTGKTTTIVEGVRYAPESRILLSAFNKRIADELNKRLPESNPNAVAKTLHALGFAAVLRNWKVKPEPGNGRADDLSDAVCRPEFLDGSRKMVPDPIKRLVSILHTKGREIAPHASVVGDLSDLQVTFECEPDETYAAEGFDAEYVERKALEAMVLAAEVKPSDGVIDFADMIYLPLRNGWLTKAYDLVVIDEAQDMTVAQLEIARGVCRGRICVVGDPNQAIYGFRGADSDSLSRLEAELGAAKLGLTTTYRCGRVIVDLAQRFVPTFTAGSTNADGEIRNGLYAELFTEVRNADFILSRLNAPLVSTAMTLLRSGKRARIAGRDIGRGLTALVRKLAKGSASNSIPMFIERVGSWKDREVTRILPQLKNKKTAHAAENKMQAIEDQASMLVELAEGALSVRDVERRIEELFTDDGLGAAGFITLSSVHKAKGLEASRVYILADTLRGHTQEERNIQYVAITRAKDVLTFVRKVKEA